MSLFRYLGVVEGDVDGMLRWLPGEVRGIESDVHRGLLRACSLFEELGPDVAVAAPIAEALDPAAAPEIAAAAAAVEAAPGVVSVIDGDAATAAGAAQDAAQAVESAAQTVAKASKTKAAQAAAESTKEHA